MTQRDSLKESNPNPSPNPPQVSVPPPYATVAPKKDTNDEVEGTWNDTTFDTRPGNNFRISRTWRALTGFRFTLDPNIELPESLQPYHDRLRSLAPSNLELGVQFGRIEADVDVLPFHPVLDDGQPPERPFTRRASREYAIAEHKRRVHIKATTSTGNITLRVNAAPDTPLVLTTESTWGTVRVSLPRTLRGPLTLSSTARLSAALRHAATPLRQENGTTYWFVGDVGAWSARDEVGDEVRVRSEFGRVWVGFVGDEPVQARGAVLTRGLKLVGPLVLLWALYWVLVVGVAATVV
ncbi:hypothetical protein C8R46DRAFT_996693 [Mycena filopes]|nr:hypothetical protein C8R46DRAFT_996693 [Mycena filopes]